MILFYFSFIITLSFGLVLFAENSYIITIKLLYLLSSLLILMKFNTNKFIDNINTIFIFFLFLVGIVFSILINSIQSQSFSSFIIPIIFSISILSSNVDFGINKFRIALIIIFCISVSFVFLQIFQVEIFDSLFAKFLGEISNNNYHYKVGRITSVWKDAPRLATLSSVLFPFFVYFYSQTKKKTDLALSVVSLLITFFSFTRIAFFASLLVIFLYTRGNLRKSFISISLVLVILYFIYIFFSTGDIFNSLERMYNPEAYSNEYLQTPESVNRLYLYIILFPAFFQNPFFGIGDSFFNILPIGFTSGHNSFLQLLIIFGIVPGIFFLSLIYKVIRKFLSKVKSRKKDFEFSILLSLFSLFFISFFHGVLMDFHFFMLFCTLIALLFNEKELLNV